jgi:hypothetical protein
MDFNRLTPDTRLLVHLSKAREYWRMDRLDLAHAAMELALQSGFPPGDLHDFQRVIEAELGARQAGEQRRVAENLVLEASTERWGEHWKTIRDLSITALTEVESAFDARWSKPVLLTVIPDGEWVSFMRARYGYYAARTDNHKICLPPSAVSSRSQILRAMLHETSHAAVQEIGGDNVPIWLNEGLAVTMEGREGGLPPAARRMSLDEVSGGFENWEVDLGTTRTQQSYAAAGEFTTLLLSKIGWDGMRRTLTAIREGTAVERAVRQVSDLSLRRLERDWIASELSV